MFCSIRMAIIQTLAGLFTFSEWERNVLGPGTSCVLLGCPLAVTISVLTKCRLLSVSIATGAPLRSAGCNISVGVWFSAFSNKGLFSVSIVWVSSRCRGCSTCVIGAVSYRRCFSMCGVHTIGASTNILST